MDDTSIFNSLATARWHVAKHTYGNSHATLIGLLVDWWISLDQTRHSAIEGAPRVHTDEGDCQCDAVLCKDEMAVGVVEVECTRQEHTANKFGVYFGTSDPDLSQLGFGILLLYTSAPRGRRGSQTFAPAASEPLRNRVKRVSEEHPSRSIILIALEKACERATTGIRARNAYYSGTVREIRAFLFRNGKNLGERLYGTGRT